MTKDESRLGWVLSIFGITILVFLLIALSFSGMWVVKEAGMLGNVSYPQPNSATIINNYYCNITEPEPVLLGTNSSVIDDNYSIIYRPILTPEPTPTFYNDTRRESVGLPADGFGNPCPCKTPCTPTITPTPTGTPICEFPWWCKA